MWHFEPASLISNTSRYSEIMGRAADAVAVYRDLLTPTLSVCVTTSGLHTLVMESDNSQRVQG